MTYQPTAYYTVHTMRLTEDSASHLALTASSKPLAGNGVSTGALCAGSIANVIRTTQLTQTIEAFITSDVIRCQKSVLFLYKNEYLKGPETNKDRPKIY